MSLNGVIASSKRKNFSKPQNSLPTYEEAIEKVPQDGLTQVFTTLELVGDQQGQSASSDRINYTYNSYNQTTNQDLSSGQGLQRPLQRPAMVHHRYYRVWHTGNPALANHPDYRQMEKQDNLGFHIISYVIGIMIVLVLIVLIVKLAQKWVTVE